MSIANTTNIAAIKKKLLPSCNTTNRTTGVNRSN